jgi:hypothetical protein
LERFGFNQTEHGGLLQVSTAFPDTGIASDVRRRVLKNIAAFMEERTKKSIPERAHKQSDADKIKKWEIELDMAYERFNVIHHFSCCFPTR